MVDIAVLFVAQFQFTHPRRMRRDARTTHAGGKTFQFSHVRSMRPAMLAANASNVNISILASMQNATTNPIAGDGTLIISILACV